MTHPNDMTEWPAIACQRDHPHGHSTRLVRPRHPHAYTDLPQLPAKLRPDFGILVWDPDVYPVDGGPYCPAHDAVSATIVSHGIWEPVETFLLARVFERGATALFVDIGAQIGWFSLLAAQFGVPTIAIEADSENVELIRASAGINEWSKWVTVLSMRIDQGTEPRWVPVPHGTVVKIDIEGAEPEAIALLELAFAAERIDHLLVEISPVFHDRYPKMVQRILDAGFDAYMFPPKHRPPVEPTPDALDARNVTEQIVDAIPSWHQENVWFKRHGVPW